MPDFGTIQDAFIANASPEMILTDVEGQWVEQAIKLLNGSLAQWNFRYETLMREFGHERIEADEDNKFKLQLVTEKETRQNLINEDIETQ